MSKKNLDSFLNSFLGTSEKLENFNLGGSKKKLEVFPTGSLLLDNALSCGGIPRGRIVQFYGAPGCGKTLQSLLTIRSAQQSDPDSMQVFIDAEQTFNSQWAKTLGIDVERVLVITGDTAVNGRELFKFLLGSPKENKKDHSYDGKSKEGLFDQIMKKGSDRLNINLVILDSLGALIPPGEDTSDVGKSNMALMARFLSPTLKKCALEVSKSNVAFIIINHVRDTMDQYGPDHTFSGGNSYHHSLSASIYYEKVARKDAMVLNEKEEIVGATIRAAVEKSKFGPSKKTEYKVNFSTGVIDRHKEIIALAIDKDIIKRPNNVMYVYNDHSWRGAEKMAEAIASDQKLLDELLSKITGTYTTEEISDSAQDTSDDGSKLDVDSLCDNILLQHDADGNPIEKTSGTGAEAVLDQQDDSKTAKRRKKKDEDTDGVDE